MLKLNSGGHSLVQGSTVYESTVSRAQNIRNPRRAPAEWVAYQLEASLSLHVFVALLPVGPPLYIPHSSHLHIALEVFMIDFLTSPPTQLHYMYP